MLDGAPLARAIHLRKCSSFGETVHRRPPRIPRSKSFDVKEPGAQKIEKVGSQYCDLHWSSNEQASAESCSSPSSILRMETESSSGKSRSSRYSVKTKKSSCTATFQDIINDLSALNLKTGINAHIEPVLLFYQGKPPNSSFEP